MKRCDRILKAIADVSGAELTLSELADLAGVQRKNINRAMRTMVATGLCSVGMRKRHGRMQLIVNPTAELTDGTPDVTLHRMAIPPDVIPSIDALLDAGFLVSKIATHLGFSESTIRNVANRSGPYAAFFNDKALAACIASQNARSAA